MHHLDFWWTFLKMEGAQTERAPMKARELRAVAVGQEVFTNSRKINLWDSEQSESPGNFHEVPKS